MDQTAPQAVHVVVRGRVQGVGFRMFIASHARKLGLNGTVRNLADGSLEAWACGPRSALERLVEEIEAGPHLAHVESCAVAWESPGRAWAGFAIVGGTYEC